MNAVDPKLVEHLRRMWSLLSVPVRPSAEGLRVYAEGLGTGRRVLVLGTTPELIDLAVERKSSRIVSMERNPATILALRQFAHRPWDGVELRCADWLEADSRLEGAFDCIACDGGLLFLDFPGLWERLLANVRRYLAPGGEFIAKMTSLPEPGGSVSSENAYAERVDALLDAHDRLRAAYPADARAHFIGLMSQLRVLTFLGATQDSGAFDTALLVRRTDQLASAMLARHPELEDGEVIRAALVHLARSRADGVDTVAGATKEQARALFRRCGFRYTATPLEDPPLPGGNYMIRAEAEAV